MFLDRCVSAFVTVFDVTAVVRLHLVCACCARFLLCPSDVIVSCCIWLTCCRFPMGMLFDSLSADQLHALPDWLLCHAMKDTHRAAFRLFHVMVA